MRQDASGGLTAGKAAASSVTIWAPGGETSTLKIPYRARNGVLVAGPKGHVFAATAFGLQECVAQDAGKPGKYSLGPVYDLAARDGERLGDLQYSGLGYLVASGFRPVSRGGIMLHLFSLTPAQPKDGPGRSAAGCRRRMPRLAGIAADSEGEVVAAGRELRTWKDGSGKFSIEAALVGVEGGKVTLRKADGSTTKVPLSTLSEADQASIGPEHAMLHDSGAPSTFRRMMRPRWMRWCGWRGPRGFCRRSKARTPWPRRCALLPRWMLMTYWW